MKNRRGFTLVEVLAVIVILGILSTIGVVTVVNIRKNQEKKFDQNQLAIFKQTAKTYFSDNKTLLPTAKDSTYVVYLKDLIDQNYLDSLLDYNKESYLLEKSYIVVMRVGTRYIYTPYLYKNGDNINEYIRPNDENPTNISFTSYKNDLGNDMTHDSTTHYTNRSSKIAYTIEDSDGIAAFNYAIYKNGKVISTSEYIEPTENKASDVFELKANNYEDGTYEIKVTVYDNTDIGSSSYSKKILIDRVAPICTTTKEPSAEWTNVNTKLIGTCSDTNGKVKGKSGCVKNIDETYTKEMNELKTPGSVEDKAGNVTICASKNIKIDKTKPSCNVSGESTAWIKGTRNITTTCSENGTYQSGCTEISKVFSYSTTTKTASLSNTVKDKAGNSATCKSTINVYVDNTAPNCGTTTVSGTAGNNGWYKSDLTLSVPCADTESGCTSSTFSNSAKSEGTNNVSTTISDKVGNTRACSNTYYIDKTPPSCGTTIVSGTAGSNGWYKSDLTLSVPCSDNLSGCTSSTFSNSAKSEGTNNVSTTISDKAGNTRACSNTYYIDKTDPTISCSLSDNNDSDGVKVTLSASDTVSGISSTSSGDSKLKSTKTYTTTDKAGRSASCTVTVVKQTRYRTRKDKECTSSSCCGTKNCNCGYTCPGPGYLLEGTTCDNHNGSKVTATWTCSKCAKTCTSSCCGFTSWGDWSSWSATSCSGTDYKDCATRYHATT